MFARWIHSCGEAQGMLFAGTMTVWGLHHLLTTFVFNNIPAFGG
jgi:hypothetical protein